MKLIKYKYLQTIEIDGIVQPLSEEYMGSITIEYSEENELKAKQEAYEGKYEIIDNDIEIIETPTQLDRIEAQVAYNSIMLGTLMEV